MVLRPLDIGAEIRFARTSAARACGHAITAATCAAARWPGARLAASARPKAATSDPPMGGALPRPRAAISDRLGATASARLRHRRAGGSRKAPLGAMLVRGRATASGRATLVDRIALIRASALLKVDSGRAVHGNSISPTESRARRPRGGCGLRTGRTVTTAPVRDRIAARGQPRRWMVHRKPGAARLPRARRAPALMRRLARLDPSRDKGPIVATMTRPLLRPSSRVGPPRAMTRPGSSSVTLSIQSFCIARLSGGSLKETAMNTRTLLASLVLTVAAAGPAVAQVQDNGGPPDPAQMRQRMTDRMKEMLGVNDDEWKALQPKVEKIQQLRRDASPRGMMMFFGPGGPGGPGAPGGPGGPPPGFAPDNNGQPPSVVQQKMADLRETLNNKDAKPEEIKSRLAALRDARAQAKADLTKAQDELRDLLTARQESVMVMMGMLE